MLNHNKMLEHPYFRGFLGVGGCSGYKKILAPTPHFEIASMAPVFSHHQRTRLVFYFLNKPAVYSETFTIFEFLV